MTKTCRHCSEEFTPLPGKPGFVDECPECLSDRGIVLPAPDMKSPRPKAANPERPRFHEIYQTTSDPNSFGACYLPDDTSILITRWPSKCAYCGDSIPVGVTVLYAATTKAIWHQKCYAEAQRLYA